jgi:hypothetical protein
MKSHLQFEYPAPPPRAVSATTTMVKENNNTQSLSAIVMTKSGQRKAIKEYYVKW